MDIKVLIFLSVLIIGWCCNARVITTHISTENEISSELQINIQYQEMEVEGTEEFGGEKQLCTLCEEFSALALGYLAENKTQTEIIITLHKTCSKLLNLEQQCITLVDYYAPLLFLEVSEVKPQEFCRRIALCGPVVSISQHLPKGNCELCHQVVAEALQKLRDPETQMDVVQMLLKLCDAVQSRSKKCKILVFEYAPLILVNAEKFLEKQDICSMLHACNPQASASGSATEQASSSQTSMLSTY